MGYSRFGRSRNFGRGFGMGWDRGRKFRFNDGFKTNPISYGGLSRGTKWTRNSPYSNMFAGQSQVFYPQQ